MELTNPSTIYEQERLDLWEKKNTIARDMKSEGLVSEDWIYDNVFNFGADDVEEMRKGVIEDKKQQFRKNSIENEGNDPAIQAQEGQLKPQPSMNDEDKEDKNKKSTANRDNEDRETYGVRDVLGKHDYANSAKRDDNPTKHNYRVSPLALSHFDQLKKHYENKEVNMLTEVEDIEREMKEKPLKAK